MLKLYQINLSRDEVNAANSGQKFPKLTAYRDAMCLGYFTGREFYEHVADLATDDLEEAFGIGNIGPEEKITRYARMHSVSVGDVLVTDAGQAYIVQNIGFAHLDNWKEAA